MCRDVREEDAESRYGNSDEEEDEEEEAVLYARSCCPVVSSVALVSMMTAFD